ncbi:MAG TPA: PAS domain S-box protein, partial [Chloroflexia bacterium]|nr:PAS domain S-box protein [Chloroflexia bacterium]
PARTWRPGGRLFVLLYSALLFAVGMLIVGNRSLDIIWTLMMLPVVVAAVLYSRRVYLVMLALYALASALVIFIGRPDDPMDTARTVVVFLAGVGAGSEAIFRFTAMHEAARRALRRSEERFRSLAAMAPVGVFEAGSDGCITYTNPRFQALFGLDAVTSAAPDAHRWTDHIHPEEREAVVEDWEWAVREGRDFSHEFRALDAAGEAHWVRMRSVVKRGPDGSVAGRTGTVEDLTDHYRAEAALTRARDELEERVHERTARLTSVVGYLEQEIADRRNAEEELRRSEERFSRVFFTSPLPMVISSQVDGRTIEVNDSFVALVGYAREELIGHSPVDVSLWQRPADRVRFSNTLRARGVVRAFETDLRIRSGEMLTVLLSAEHVSIGGEMCVLAIATDITERAEFERSLRAFAEAQSSLLDRQSEAREQERHRLADDVEEGALSMLETSLGSLDRALAGADRGEIEAARRELRTLRTAISSAAADLRDLVSSLSGHDLKEHGLGVALHAYAARYADQTGTRIAVEYTFERRLPLGLELLLFRIAQDVLGYAREEAGAAHVLVRVERDGSGAAMIVTHDGAPPAEIASPPVPSPTIEAWRRRCVALYGTLTVTSGPDSRTTITFRFPLPED